MKNVLAKVEQFHRAFELPVREAPTGNLDASEWRLRYELMVEENREYLEAGEQGDLVKVADALGDMLYVLCGTILAHGLQHKIEEVVEEIHRSNMSKLGPDGKPIHREDGKVLKSPTYFRPDLKKIL